MAEPDLGKIIELIMKNPELISKIRELADGGGESSVPIESADVTVDGNETIAEQNDGDTAEEAAAIPKIEAPADTGERSRRNELLRALKPYVSSERGKAIESMMTIADILDLMRKK